MIRRIAAVLTGAATVVLLAACSSGGGGSVAVSVEKGAPAGWDADAGTSDGTPIAGWIVEQKSFAVVTWGSSGCPPVATSLSAESSDQIRIVFAAPEQEVCTADFAPTTHTFNLPESVNNHPIGLALHFEQFDENYDLTLD